LYAESVADAKRLWLRTNGDAAKFLLPRRDTIYFLVLCKPGWFVSDLLFAVETLSCYDISRNSR